jgi:ribosomal-protein-alanine N-acetyltransferase
MTASLVPLGELRLRRALTSDVDQLVELARRSWLSAFSERAPFALIADWLRTDRESEWYPAYFHEVWLAEAGSTLLGLVQPRRDEINGLWVHPSWQRRGVGSFLLRSSERRIKAAGYTRAWLTCSRFNPRAIAFYAARGYLEERRYSERLPCGVDEEYLVFERGLLSAE